jgi:subtilase family serine protease
MRRRRPRARLAFECLDDRCLPTTLTPAQVTAAYGLNAVAFPVAGQSIKGNGAGQVIAIVDAYHDPYIASDLVNFDQTYGLSNPAFAVVNLGGSATDDGWAMEEALDVEWAHAIAPGASIIVVEARSDSLNDLLAAVKVASSIPSVSVVSMSWGSSEFSGQTALDSYFTAPAGHQGITYVAASGDEGASGGAEWPAASAKVLSVGGTTLNVASNGTYLGESLWSGSSGGQSSYVPEPAYQYSLQRSGRLTTPDVSFVGDPNTGVAVYTTAPSNGSASWYQVGGTSLGSPAWAAIVAIADQGRALTGKTTLDGASQTLPILFAMPSTYFHKVASSYGVTAGLGTPAGPAVVYGLVYGAAPGTASSSTTKAAKVATTTTRAAVTISPPGTYPTGPASAFPAVVPAGASPDVTPAEAVEAWTSPSGVSRRSVLVTGRSGRTTGAFS